MKWSLTVDADESALIVQRDVVLDRDRDELLAPSCGEVGRGLGERVVPCLDG